MKRKSSFGKLLLPLNLSFFGEATASGGSEAESAGAERETADPAEEASQQGQANESSRLDTLEQLIQAKTESRSNEQEKTIKSLQKQLERLAKEKLSEEELKRFEIEEKERQLTEKEHLLLDRENRLYAIKALKQAGLDDGSDKTLRLVDFVIADEQKRIEENIKVFKGVIDSFVAAEVEQRFREGGRRPDSSVPASDTAAVPELLGRSKAESIKQSEDILSYYSIGG